MNTIIELLDNHPQLSDYKVNVRSTESCELFFVKGKLETVRRTKTCDKEVTVYVDHGSCKGDAQFFVYPSTSPEQIRALIDEAAAKALLIQNEPYTLPTDDTGAFEVESNFSTYDPLELATMISSCVFSANMYTQTSLNSVEIFINKYTDTVRNSRGIYKTQVSYDAMVEAIPTFNGEDQSVELYEQYNFARFDQDELFEEIANKMAEVVARYEAAIPTEPISCKVILNKKELAELFFSIAGSLNYSAVYARSNLFKKGDIIQKKPRGDLIGITMAGEVPGNVRSAKFDTDGLSLRDICLVEDGRVVNYYGSNRFGQYLGEEPTGNLRCLCVDPGSTGIGAFSTGPFLEVMSMSGLQVDFYNDYIGGEVRLAYHHNGTKIVPVTGLSISGKLSDVLNHIHLSSELAVHNGYVGPMQAILEHMKIF